MDVADWLQQLGLERYAEAFRENDIGFSVLPALTADDLKELGVASVGHRRQLLEGIAALRTAPPAREGGASAERRQLSVMFCDVVGFTALSARLDPEDLGTIIREYQARVAGAVGAWGGFIARYVGDGILVYFGWPEAHEADAEKAVRAALAVVETVGGEPVHAERLQVRIGVATGLVVVGEPIGTSSARQQTAIGETPNLAARLQALAAPNGIIIDAVTRRQIGTLFDCCDLGAFELKGLAGPVKAWQVMCEADANSRFQALRGDNATRLVGRQEELDLLLRRWKQAGAGQGRVVLISGEPGIGKSRLLAALDEELQALPHTNLRYFCSPHHQDSPLHPVIRQLEMAAGFARDDDPAGRAIKLKSLLALAKTPDEDVALVMALLLPTQEPSILESPKRRTERTFDALISLVERLSIEHTLLMVFEDVHWADPSTLDFIDVLIRRIVHSSSLLILTFRPEFSAPWVGHAGITLLTLSRLDRDDATILATQLTSQRRLPAALIDNVVTQSDGIPLFIEELTRSVMESAEVTPASAIAVPATLHASLMARLDRIPVAKQIAQIGAVIGRDFPRTLVAGVTRLSEAQLTRGFDELVASGIAFRRGVGPDVVYTFKHALVQEIAYDSLLRRRRGELHAAIVELAEHTESDAGIEPGVLAYHCAQAGLTAKAANYYRIAGERSAERLGMAETRRQLEQGLQLAERLPAGPDRYRLEAELWIGLGRILLPTKGQAHPETRSALSRAVDICRRFDSGAMLIRALYGLGIVEEVRGDLRGAQTIGEELVALAAARNDPSIALAARARLGSALFYQGRFMAAQDVLSQAVDLLAQGTPMSFDVAVSSTPALPVLSFMANTFACLGNTDEAVTYSQQAVRQARQLAPTSLAFALHGQLRTAIIMDDVPWCRETAEQQVALCEEYSLPPFLSNALCALGWTSARCGNAPEGLRLLTEGTRMLDALGSKVSASMISGLMADTLALSGRTSDAMAVLDEALALAVQTGAAWLDAELLRRKAELLSCGPPGDPVAVEAEFQRAIDIARSQSARLLELRASLGLSKLLCRDGRRDEAHVLLRSICGWFAEQSGAADVADAHSLLAALNVHTVTNAGDANA
jgi:class 3 adenylate cyclase/tetratricopeptide (TPR) repeat protein